jgi:hypothetical protein
VRLSGAEGRDGRINVPGHRLLLQQRQSYVDNRRPLLALDPHQGDLAERGQLLVGKAKRSGGDVID